jgi:hypothetical protein
MALMRIANSGGGKIYMRILAWAILIVALGSTLGCNQFLPADTTGESTDIELQGAHYAKLNSIGCYNHNDIITTKSADFDTIDNLIREKRCFVIPTDKDIFLTGRTMDGIVKAKIGDIKDQFYTYRSNLSRK